MKDNNPFQPALSQPVDDSVLATDPSADNFAEDGLAKTAKPARPAVMLDGISPNVNDNAPINPDTLAQALGNHDVSDIDMPTDNTNDAATPFTLDDVRDDTKTDDLAAAIDTPNEVDAAATDSDETSSAASPLDQIAALTDESKKIPTPPADAKPPKQFTISIATIVLFILALAGIGGTVYFWLQNNKNSDALADANAKVQQLTDQSNQNNTSDNKTSGQFDALQDKIADLTTQNEDKQKTLDENKKTIDDQTKQITDLKSQNEDLNKKVQNINDLTTKLDTVLNNCTTDGTSGQLCTIKINSSDT